MIRIYLDWNVFSNLKTPAYAELKALINSHKQDIQIVYSETHFNDLMVSYTPENQLFFEDIQNLDDLTQGHFLYKEDDVIIPFNLKKVKEPQTLT
jgi:hypothetical protein